MFKRIVTAIVILLGGMGASFAGNVSSVRGPQDPSQLNALMNALIVSGNTSWNPGGTSFLYTNVVTAAGSQSANFGGFAPSGMVSPNIVAWMKVHNPSSTSTNIYPHFYLIPMFGVNNP